MNKLQHRKMSCENLAQIADILERERGLNNKKLAETLGVSDAVFNNWKMGKNYPDQYAMCQLRRLYGVTLDWIYCGDPSGLPQWIHQNLKLS
jgi:ribosome-binding protein aMBF1 (putative translation factor)